MIESIKNKLYKPLKWSEGIFKTDMIYVAKSGFWLTIGNGVSMMSAFLLSLAFARFVPKEIYGNYKFILSISSILGIFYLSGTGQALASSVARGFDGTIRYAFWTNLKWDYIASIIYAAISVYYFLAGNYNISISFIIIGILSPIIASAILYDSFLIGKKDFRTETKYVAIQNIFSALTIFITLYFFSGAPALILANLLSTAVITTVLLVVTVKKYSPSRNIDYSIKDLSFHLSAINILSTIADNIDHILIFHYLGGAKLAIYAFAIAIPNQIKGFFKNISTLALPKFSEQDMKSINKMIARKMLIVGGLALLISIVYIIVAPTIYELLFPAYKESVIYSQILSLSLIGMMASLPYTALQSQGKKREIYFYNISFSIIKILLTVVLIYYYDIWGAIFSIMASRFISIPISYYLIRKK